MSMLSIGVTGLNAAQMGLLTTEHNIANVNTQGYNRQRTLQSTVVPVATGSGFFGQGVQVDTVERIYNQFITGQVMQSSTKVSELDAFHDEISLIDNMLADPNSGLSPALQDFFRGLQQVAADPASLPARQAMVSSSETLVARFHSIEQRLADQYSSINEQLVGRVSVVNSLATRIAEINQRIVVSQASTGHIANDLLDQRDQLIAEMNQEFRVQTVTQSDGTLSVFAGNGQQLVVGVQANQLRAQPSVADPERFVIAVKSGLTFQELPEDALSGGKVGGLIRFRSESLDAAANSLGRIANSMALNFNAQHATGQDLLGNIDGSAGFVSDYFQIGTPKLVANLLNTGTPDLAVSYINPPPQRFNNGDFSITYTAAGYEVVSPKYGIAPGAVVQPTMEQALRAVDLLPGVPAIDPATANFYTDLSTSDYKVQFDASGSNFTITRLSDLAVMGAGTVGGAAVRFDGLSVVVPTSAAGANDSFVIQPGRESARNFKLNTAIAADPRLIAAGLPVRSATSTNNTGSGKIDVAAVAPGYVAPSGATPIQIAFANNQITITGSTSANITVTSGASTTAQVPGVPFAYTPDAVITVDGLSFTLAGQPKTGDTFTILRNTNGVSDSRNALLLGKLQSQDTMAGGTTSFQGAYGQLVSGIGNKTREIQVTGDAQRSLLEQAQGAREAASGVNLDEEAANLIRFQQAYQAAARVIDVGSRLFDVLISVAA